MPRQLGNCRLAKFWIRIRDPACQWFTKHRPRLRVKETSIRESRIKTAVSAAFRCEPAWGSQDCLLCGLMLRRQPAMAVFAAPLPGTIFH
jgi:hypothetical protein